jgi:acetolactate synthase-1/2/3 large subunit
MPTTVEVLAVAIKDAGTPFIIGHPGGESVNLMDAARQRDMRFVLMKQEVAGDAGRNLGREHRLAGMCLSTRGPGATHMVNRVAYALIDRAPLIAITDQYAAPIYETGLRQRINQQAVSTPLAKRSSMPYVAQFNALREL